jgi:hypothetical protein
MSPQSQSIDQFPADEDRAQTVLNAYAGDALAALRSVISDADFLCDQLETASHMISPGLVRGWKPKFERGA